MVMGTVYGQSAPGRPLVRRGTAGGHCTATVTV